MGRRKANLQPGYGERLKQARLRVGLRQTDLAGIVDMREFTLSRYENEVIEPDRCFLAGLEHLTGIQRVWVEEGVEPMVRELASYGAAQALKERLGGDQGPQIVPCPPTAGMEGLPPGKGFLLLRGAKAPLRSGGAFWVDERSGVTAGIARRSKRGWLLYHELDTQKPGSYPPTLVTEGVGVEIVAKVLLLDPC